MDRNGPLSAEISIFRQKLALSAETDLFRLISAFGRKSSPEIPLFRFWQKVFRLISTCSAKFPTAQAEFGTGEHPIVQVNPKEVTEQMNNPKDPLYNL